MNVKIHPSADVQSQQIGTNTVIWQNTIILNKAVIGSNCNINCFCFIENDVNIGNNVTIKAGVFIWDGITIEDDAFIGPNVTFTNDIYPRSKQYPEFFAKTVVKKGASIGANATIIAGNTVGEYSLVGAGSLISRNIPPFTIWFGNPATHKGYITAQGVKVALDLTDAEGNEYLYENNNLIKK